MVKIAKAVKSNLRREITYMSASISINHDQPRRIETDKRECTNIAWAFASQYLFHHMKWIRYIFSVVEVKLYLSQY